MNSNLNQLTEKETVTIGYARVSSRDDRQLLGLTVQIEALSFCNELFIEKESGASDNRPELCKALIFAKRLAQSGQSVCLVIYKLDRLSRCMFRLLELVRDLNSSGIQLISLHENIDTKTLTGQLICLVLGYVAEMELENIKFRTREGLKKAKAKGRKLGNPGISKETEEEILALLNSQISVIKIANHCGVCRSTVYNVKNRHLKK